MERKKKMIYQIKQKLRYLIVVYSDPEHDFLIKNYSPYSLYCESYLINKNNLFTYLSDMDFVEPSICLSVCVCVCVCARACVCVSIFLSLFMSIFCQLIICQDNISTTKCAHGHGT